MLSKIKSKKYFIDILFEKQIKEKDKIKCIESILTKICKEKIVFQKDTAHLDSNLYLSKIYFGGQVYCTTWVS